MSDFTGHTPGPWEVEYGQLHPASEKKGYTIRTDAYDVVSGHLAIRREEDARLIAAAPDLLAERDQLLGIIAEFIWVEDTIDGFADDEPLWDDMVELDRRQKAVWEVARKALQESAND